MWFNHFNHHASLLRMAQQKKTTTTQPIYYIHLYTLLFLAIIPHRHVGDRPAACLEVKLPTFPNQCALLRSHTTLLRGTSCLARCRSSLLLAASGALTAPYSSLLLLLASRSLLAYATSLRQPRFLPLVRHCHKAGGICRRL